MINVSKDVWKDIAYVLDKYQIPYVARYESRDLQKVIVTDKHIQINLVIPDYFEENI